jgi:putative YhdH/YhfP family quinone oxidoreductase
MIPQTFTAVLIEDVGGKPKAAFKSLRIEDLPDNDVLIEVEFSSLNYKDALAISGKGRIARRLPMLGGIDLAGSVVESRSPLWKVGERVIVNGWGLSEHHWGGYTPYARMKPEWLTRLPIAFTPEQAMAIGTAGYTAALCVDALERWGSILQNAAGEILVTGAAGGVGSVTIALLAKRGYQVVASTGRPHTHDYLRQLGARDFIDRRSLESKGAPLQKERWSGAVDCVGGQTLATVLSQAIYGAAVTACGLAGGSDLPATVLPHILRSVTLIGVDSVMAPHAARDAAWSRLSRDLDASLLASMTTVEPLSQLPALADSILAGEVRGRIVIDVRR